MYRMRSNNVDWEKATGSPSNITSEGGSIYLSPWPIRAGTLVFPYVINSDGAAFDDGTARDDAWFEL